MKLLFICPDWADLATPIVEELRRQGHEVTHLDTSDLADFHYYSKPHRVMSKMLDLVSKEKYKHQRTEEQIYWSLKGVFKGSGKYDAIICTEPNIFNQQHFTLMKQHSGKLVLSLWDSLNRMPQNGTDLDQFDVIFSFEPEDCQRHGFIQTYNYIPPIGTCSPIEEAKHDLFSVMSFTKKRYEELCCFLDANPTIDADVYLYIDHPRKRKFITHERIKVTEHLMLKDELAALIQSSCAVLDLGQGKQNGLSFRVYESLAYNRKLVTTSQDIAQYEFYDQSNIAIIKPDNVKLPDGFFELNYKKPAPKTTSKYTLESWVENLTEHIGY
ncbi:hypothetical protein [Vibrio sp. CyArs1]|uniref:hypothetical protein n=1 Tax=Vibrio sp. CyArs1 TaxID=2682577 RepID=UPI001F06CB43|nr:hypothetical protein [Vibrio sp. CyArs1]